MLFTSGLRHTFFDTGVSPELDWRTYICARRRLLGQMQFVRLGSLLLYLGDQAARQKVVQQLGELGRALVGADLIFGEQRIEQLVETLGLFQPLPDGGRDCVEAEAMAGIWIERDQLVPDLGFHQVNGASVHSIGHSQFPILRREDCSCSGGQEVSQQ